MYNIIYTLVVHVCREITSGRRKWCTGGGEGAGRSPTSGRLLPHTLLPGLSRILTGYAASNSPFVLYNLTLNANRNNILFSLLLYSMTSYCVKGFELLLGTRAWSSVYVQSRRRWRVNKFVESFRVRVRKFEIQHWKRSKNLMALKIFFYG